jgi:hypothetical protein
MRASTQKVSSKTQQVTEVQKFYNWMAKMNSIHLADNERMSRAYESVIQNSLLFSSPNRNPCEALQTQGK